MERKKRYRRRIHRQLGVPEKVWIDRRQRAGVVTRLPPIDTRPCVSGVPHAGEYALPASLNPCPDGAEVTRSLRIASPIQRILVRPIVAAPREMPTRLSALR